MLGKLGIDLNVEAGFCSTLIDSVSDVLSKKYLVCGKKSVKKAPGAPAPPATRKGTFLKEFCDQVVEKVDEAVDEYVFGPTAGPFCQMGGEEPLLGKQHCWALT